MKTIKLCAAVLVLSATAFTTIKAQTADEIIKKNIDATGGEKNWRKVTTLKATGTAQSGGADISITRTVITNKAMRLDIAFNGVNGYTIITQDSGWSFFPFQGQTAPQAMTAEQVKSVQDQLDVRGELFDYKAKGSKAEYQGKDSVNGKYCYKLQLTDKDNKTELMYIDVTTNYLVRSINKLNANGQDMDVISTFSDYKKLPEGIVWPMTVNAQGSDIKIASVEINKPVDEALFKPSLK